MPAPLHDHGHASFLALVVMWQAMMLVMMTPVVWPWLRAYERLCAAPSALPAMPARGASRAAAVLAATTSFAAGYFTAWLAFSVLAAGVQSSGTAAGAIAAGAFTSPLLRAVVLAAAGVYQFAPLKRACLTHCRNPLTYFLARWRGGPAGGFRLGAAHGLHCVGCCWALMLAALAVGTMNLWWMTVLAASSFVEQVLPGGHRVRVPLGMAMLVGSIRLALG